jgi:hypothetical protein
MSLFDNRPVEDVARWTHDALCRLAAALDADVPDPHALIAGQTWNELVFQLMDLSMWQEDAP